MFVLLWTVIPLREIRRASGNCLDNIPNVQKASILAKMGEIACFRSLSSTAVENRASFMPKKRLIPGYREKKLTRVVGKPLSHCPRHIFLVGWKPLSHTSVGQNARRYCRRHVRTTSFSRRFSCCSKVTWHSEEWITMRMTVQCISEADLHQILDRVP